MEASSVSLWYRNPSGSKFKINIIPDGKDVLWFCGDVARLPLNVHITTDAGTVVIPVTRDRPVDTTGNWCTHSFNRCFVVHIESFEGAAAWMLIQPDAACGYARAPNGVRWSRTYKRMQSDIQATRCDIVLAMAHHRARALKTLPDAVSKDAKLP